MTDFTLDPQLAADCIEVTQWPLCTVLLMNDQQYPWCILVPRRANVSELFELDASDTVQFYHESRHLSVALMNAFAGEKLNVAALGNVVRQLHIHHVVRYQTDPTWPAPIWGKRAPQPYAEDELQAVLRKLRQALVQASASSVNI